MFHHDALSSYLNPSKTLSIVIQPKLDGCNRAALSVIMHTDLIALRDGCGTLSGSASWIQSLAQLLCLRLTSPCPATSLLDHGLALLSPWGRRWWHLH